jgi:hypothetical protein
MKCWSPFDVPYEVHTDRELQLMLSRGKPLAHFSEAYPPEPAEEVIPRAAFAPHVADGTFEMREFVELRRGPPIPRALQVRGSLHVFYARPDQAWRIEAYIAMLSAAARAGWSEGFERLQGFLLGYSEAETDAHIEHLLEAPHARDFPWLVSLLADRRR